MKTQYNVYPEKNSQFIIVLEAIANGIHLRLGMAVPGVLAYDIKFSSDCRNGYDSLRKHFFVKRTFPALTIALNNK